MTNIVQEYEARETTESVIFSFTVQEGTTLDDIEIELTPTSIKAGLKGKNPVIQGKLFDSIDPNSSEFVLVEDDNQHSVIITLQKSQKIEFKIHIIDKYEGSIDPHSSYLLSIHYFHKNEIELAVDFLQIAANVGHYLAAYQMALVFNEPTIAQSYGQQTNPELAFKYFKIAADMQLPAALFFLGTLCESGKGCQKDLNLAKDYYEKALQLNFFQSAHNLGLLYCKDSDEIKQDYERAFEYFQIAEENGYEMGSYRLGLMYIYGLGTEINFEKAQECFDKITSKNSNFKIPQNVLELLERGQEDYETKLKKSKTLTGTQTPTPTPTPNVKNDDYDEDASEDFEDDENDDLQSSDNSNQEEMSGSEDDEIEDDKNKKKKDLIKWGLTIGATVLITSCGIGYYLKSKRKKEKNEK
ncbi:sel-1-like protein [Anaeramoeba flamelloides]|uniref:Sel-1-like protein n=1 Tax=Anaeramoeba flamelloides TaxID=1746091 RepID=A0AAV8AH92_9EUKA|nr:sel-1-like protein [Anaeramoeba flamelloides]